VALIEKAMKDANRADMPSFVKKFINEDTLALARLQAQNKIPILVINLLSFGLCLAGAIQMRKQKMMGYYYWLIGELLPIAGMAIFASFAAYKGFGMFGLLVPAIFIVLYSTQRKNLTK
jgi:hypothetical protein